VEWLKWWSIWLELRPGSNPNTGKKKTRKAENSVFSSWFPMDCTSLDHSLLKFKIKRREKLSAVFKHVSKNDDRKDTHLIATLDQ
jgi:hypothetical protein